MEQFKMNGAHFKVFGDRLGVVGERKLEGVVRNPRLDEGDAEIQLLVNCVSKVVRNGKTIFDKSKNTARDIPSEVNAEDRDDTTGIRLLRFALKHEPHIYERHEEMFEYLFEDEDGVPGEDGTGDAEGAEGAKPTHSSGESSVFPSAEVT